MSKKSFVWDYFDPLTNDASKAKCKLCDCLISRGGTGKKATTSSMLNHLKIKHAEYSKELKQENTSETENLPKIINQGVKRKQTLEDCIEKKKLWDINHDRAMKFHKIIGEMIACDNQPYSFVEDPGFIKLMREAEPRYKVPSRHYFQQTVVPDLYEACKKKISSVLANADEVSLTSDIWTSSVNNHSFISVTGHWISDEFNYHHAVIDVKHFPGSHTGDAVGDVIKTVCSEWKLNKIHLALRDGGTNMVKGLNVADINSECCFLHLLHLVVTDALSSQRTINDLICLSKKIVGHFNHSSLACSRLREIQIKNLGIQDKKLVQDVPTRWNSTYYMLERIKEQKNAISLYATEFGFGKTNNLTANQWMLLEKLLNLLQPFESITKEVSSTKCLISVVIPMITTLKLCLSKPGEHFSGVGTMKEELLKNLDERFSSFQSNENYSIATILDPRFKIAFFCKTNTDEVSMLKSKLLSMMRTMDTSMEISETTSNVSITKEVNASNSFWDCFSELTKSSVSNNGNELENLPDATELNTFLKKPLLERVQCPLTWWKENSTTFPKLSSLAKKYLSAPASTVYSERLFSEAGNIYEKKRNRILPENAAKLIFLHHNLRLFNDV